MYFATKTDVVSSAQLMHLRATGALPMRRRLQAIAAPAYG
jgi:hypothetical protein